VRIPTTVPLLASLLVACAPLSVAEVHVETRASSELATNAIAFLSPFPEPACTPLPRDVIDLYARRPAPPRSPLRLTRSWADAGVIVNTDIDDTLIPNLWDRGRYARNALYPGAVQLLVGEGGAQRTALVALTARDTPEQTLEQLEGWLARDLGDARAWERVEVSTGEPLNFSSIRMGLVKARVLAYERKQHPDTPVIFNGDGGQGDWLAALLLSDLHPDPRRFYATLHDVRAWSAEARRDLDERLAHDALLAGIYRYALDLPEGASVEARVARFRAAVREVFDPATGRFQAAALRRRNVFLHRNHAALALDLVEAGLLDRGAADRVLRAAVPRVCFAPKSAPGFDDERDQRCLAARLRAFAGEGDAPAECGKPQG
jgi:hypothetical protein